MYLIMLLWLPSLALGVFPLQFKAFSQQIFALQYSMYLIMQLWVSSLGIDNSNLGHRVSKPMQETAGI